jgi:hypothetical protein
MSFNYYLLQTYTMRQEQQERSERNGTYAEYCVGYIESGGPFSRLLKSIGTVAMLVLLLTFVF